MTCALALLCALLWSPTTDARLHAYYVVQNVSLGGITPRILFVLDTSGSMVLRAQATPDWCNWTGCEDGTNSDISRVAAARRAINLVVEDYKDQARFALMTFSRESSPSKAAEVPEDCDGGTGSGPRFRWIEGYVDYMFWQYFWDYSQATYAYNFGTAVTWNDFFDRGLFPAHPALTPAYFYSYLYGFASTWRPFEEMYNGVNGHWQLCGENRPYPYIRWDEVNAGVGAPSGGSVLPLANNDTTEYGPGPLLTQSELIQAGNASRAVAWFPRFMGTRVNLDHTDPDDRLDLCYVYGDYGERSTNNATPCLDGSKVGASLINNVSGEDFYYWPYLDGFPGYSYHAGVRRPSFNEVYSDLNNSKKSARESEWWWSMKYLCNAFGYGDTCLQFSRSGGNTGVFQFAGDLGVQTQPSNVINDKSELFVPFYQPGVVAGLNDGSIKYDEWYPMSSDEASDALLGLTSPMADGGMDVSGSTPWLSAVGETNSSTPVVANSPFSNGGTISKYIQWVRTVEPADVCSPIATVLITDGEPTDPSGGALSAANWKTLNKALAGLRDDRESKVYVVGFFIDPSSNNPAGNPAINDMACAGTGAGDANNTNPCTVAPGAAHNFDTCRDPNDPANDCAFLADSPEELALVLTQIVEGELAMDVPAGSGASVNSFGTSGGGSAGITQTNVSARTEWPAWKGHVERDLCDDLIDDPNNPGTEILAPYCQAANFDEVEETFGPCPQSRSWDAGTCLEQTPWADRRIYITDAANNIHPIYSGGSATTDFVDQLNAADLAIPGAPFDVTSATLIAEFIMGHNWKDGWKLPGLAASSPTVVRRIPEPDPLYAPSVGIRDPHCSGRLLASPEEVDEELVSFAEDAWDPAKKLSGAGFGAHYEYQEAVLIGDDLGLLHAFQFDSGNEIFALMPRFTLKAAVEEYAYGGEEMGQSDKLDEHIYGVSATANHGWVYDDIAAKWRHLAIVGMGEGGKHLMALDVSHMSVASAKGPIEVLWTSNDAGLKTYYEAALGETWARPALTYHIDELSEQPETFLVFGSGYADDVATSGHQGRRLTVADALTGQMLKYADLPSPTTPLYESKFASVVDPAVGTHCISRFWGEAQETYIADPAGRLYRWDLGEKTSVALEGEADSGVGKWAALGNVAQPVATFAACDGASVPCSMSSGGVADPFLFAPAVVSINRIDDVPGNSGQGIGAEDQDQFMVALVSGSPYDSTLDANDPSNTFHPSVYILTDDHRADKHGGFNIPSGASRIPAGTNSAFMREVVTDMTRTRRFLPYPTFSPSGATPCPNGASWNATVGMCEETSQFSKRVRPIRAPRISVTGLNKLTGCVDINDPSTCVNSTTEEGIEMYTIEFSVFEPGTGSCDAGWYDPVEEIWYFDQGASYVLSYSVAVNDATGFDLVNGAGLSYLTDGGSLSFNGVQQNLEGACADGVCGPVPSTPGGPPCDPNDYSPPADVTYTIPLMTSEIEGFSRVETAGDAPPIMGF